MIICPILWCTSAAKHNYISFMYKFVWLHVAFFEQVSVCVYVTLSVCVFVVNKVKIDLLLLVYICDAVIQNNNMLISNGKSFSFFNYFL